ncbi:MAG: homoserine O-acetyltransferase [Endomicrobiaceae bacterium]|nr:homoserine O-acetyltransferase [Endomicrobiaceae bacterium]MDD3922363.1 homoserine O-acetyltransferase [Endomicrobiaceae bacterium]MDD5101433.1 homoserine O-acetyltransferase [Endomicrobiaceae bacterium]
MAIKISSKNVGIVETKYFTFNDLVLENKHKLSQVTVAYETYGTLSEKKDNAILIAHAFTGDAHCAGYHEGDEKPGWWDSMIGHKKAFDTDKYFVICSNVLAGCQGTTGPSSINSETGKEYGTDFPVISMADIVTVQKRLVEYLGIEKLLSVAGGSMGGMQVLQWAMSYPENICSAIPIATTMRHSPQQIAFNEVGRQSVMGDIAWKDGHYYQTGNPDRGLAVARMLGHITYMSDVSMQKKFPIKEKEKSVKFDFNADFEVEEYLRYRGSAFVKRFDANTYLYISKAMDHFDVQKEDFLPAEKNINIKFLVISFKSDWLYPSYQSENIVKYLKMKGQYVTYCNIHSTYGHDAFLLEIKDETNLIKNFLSNLYDEVNSVK